MAQYQLEVYPFGIPGSTAQETLNTFSDPYTQACRELALSYFSQGLLTPPMLDKGPKPPPAQVQAMVDAFQKASRTLLPISVVKNPSEIDGIPVNVAPGSKPTGGVVRGRIYLFTNKLRSSGEALVAIFRKLFHYGLQNVVPAEQYAVLIRDSARNALLQRYMNLWKDSSGGRVSVKELNSAAYEAWTTKEGLVMILEGLLVSDGWHGTNPDDSLPHCLPG